LGMEHSLQALVGMRVSHIWFSDYSICYVELGALSAGRVLRNGKTGNPRGEASVFLGYDWLIKSGYEELSRLELHANMDERDVLASKMIGQTIDSACLGATRLEIEIGISNGVVLKSASSFDEDPTWNVQFRLLQ
jgi:hypothetical protein